VPGLSPSYGAAAKVAEVIASLEPDLIVLLSTFTGLNEPQNWEAGVPAEPEISRLSAVRKRKRPTRQAADGLGRWRPTGS
jgi:hypothetical protein